MTLDDRFLSHVFYELFEGVMILLVQVQLGPSALLFYWTYQRAEQQLFRLKSAI